MATATIHLETEVTRSRRSSGARRAGLFAVLLATGALALSACNVSQDLINAINSSRASVGARALTPNATLTFKAQSWANYMASTRQLVHSNLGDGNNLAWKSLAENIGTFPAGYNAVQMNQAFYNSTSHRANMLNKNFNYIGVGVASDSTGRQWVAEEFMQL